MSFREMRSLISYLRRPHFSSSEYLYMYQRHSRSFFSSKEALSKLKEAPARFSHPPSITLPSSVNSGKLDFVSWYLRMLESRPVMTKSVTAGIIFTVADLSSQVFG